MIFYSKMVAARFHTVCKNYGTLDFRRLVFSACGLPDLSRRVGIKGSNAQSNN
jgi:hypothetical protein